MTPWLAGWLTIVPFLLPPIDTTGASPPVAGKSPRVTSIHGENLVDDYYWLREKTNPAVISYLDQENAYTAAVTRSLEPEAEALYMEMRGRIKEADLDVPYRLGDFFYYTRTEQGQQYPLYARKRGSLDAPEEVMLDLNELVKGEKFLSVASTAVSDDGNLLAYAVDVTGFRLYTLRIKDLRTGQLLPDRIEKVNAPVWSSDGRTIFYVAEDAAKRPFRLMRHAVGSTDADTPVYDETDELFRLGVSRTRDRQFFVITSRSSTTSEVRLLPTGTPDAPLRVLVPRRDGHEYDVEHRNGLLYIRTNQDAKNFRVVTAPVSTPDPAHWTELVAARPTVNVADIDLFRDFAVVTEREGGLPQLSVIDLKDGKTPHRVQFPEPAYNVSLDRNPEFNTTDFRLRYTSLVTPSSVYDYDPAHHDLTLRKRTEVLGGYDQANYVSEWTHASAADGTQIPISLVYRKGTKLDGSSPLLLYGYGSYGAPMAVAFNSSRLSLIDRGVIYAQGHIRGGGDLGEPWHDGGKMMAKKNTFTDFIAVGDHLVARGYTSHEKMAIRGASAGGLLIGAVVNLRPDLAKVAILEVPFVDVINTMLDASLPLTVQEYLEWGNPNGKEAYDYMKTYCPYTNLAKRAYPSILVRTSLNDSQVMYWEPAKYVARLRTLKTDSNPLLLKVNMAAGHGGASGRFDALKEQAFVAAFLLDQLGVPR